MADYRTPLPAMLAGAVEAGINRVLAMDEQSIERLERLEGKLLQLDLEGLAITLYFQFAFSVVEVTLDADREPDARISGTPTALFSLAAPVDGKDWGTPGSGVRIEGDANLARDLGRVFEQLDPDWQASLDRILGENLGYQVGQGLRQGADGLRRTLDGVLDLAGRFLREESGELAEQEDIDGFNRGVDDLRDGMDRLDVRLARIERRRAADLAEQAKSETGQDPE